MGHPEPARPKLSGCVISFREADRIADCVRSLDFCDEVLVVDSEIASMIHANAPVAEIEQVARRNGMTTMLEDGFSKCLAGETTTEEVMRVSIEL